MMHPICREYMTGFMLLTTRNNTSLPNSPLAAIYESDTSIPIALICRPTSRTSHNVPWVKGLSVKVTGAYDYTTSHNKNL
ncbi:hypothetical protein NXV28_00140 [Bacteroides ovatus]|uniref:hypothetical protein n=1 Tax=Bacteroides ovatus TaxID=28116 RepID=UPI0021655FD8|nr:hypothetical protein [Bacteroides ovatus]MCS2799155.1 hypothetical protein [Bacteroides ovatus]